MEICEEYGRVIWLIDDDQIQQFCFKKTLEIQGISKPAMTFFDGEEAINYLNEHSKEASLLPDIIFLDLNMPHVNGWQFLQRYSTLKQQLNKQTKIYVLSSSINRADINRASAIPEVSGYYSKPLKPDDINQILTEV